MKISPVNYYPIGRTQFYPGYNEHRDQVDAVSPIKPISFQKVLPRYDLNTGDTRSSGVGPSFDSGLIERKVNKEVGSEKPSHKKAPGKQLDVYA